MQAGGDGAPVPCSAAESALLTGTLRSARLPDGPGLQTDPRIACKKHRGAKKKLQHVAPFDESAGVVDTQQPLMARGACRHKPACASQRLWRHGSVSPHLGLDQAPDVAPWRGSCNDRLHCSSASLATDHQRSLTPACRARVPSRESAETAPPLRTIFFFPLVAA